MPWQGSAKAAGRFTARWLPLAIAWPAWCSRHEPPGCEQAQGATQPRPPPWCYYTGAWEHGGGRENFSAPGPLYASGRWQQCSGACRSTMLCKHDHLRPATLHGLCKAADQAAGESRGGSTRSVSTRHGSRCCSNLHKALPLPKLPSLPAPLQLQQGMVELKPQCVHLAAPSQPQPGRPTE